MSLLEVVGLSGGYGRTRVLRDLDFSVGEGEVIAMLGANGAGKTTTLRALSGMVTTVGSIRLAGSQLIGCSVETIVRRGVAHVPEDRGLFTSLDVEENLRLGAYTRGDSASCKSDMERWFSYFPRLQDCRKRTAGLLSGGEQQMLALARALMLRPRLLLLDEPSLGLAPMAITELFRALAEIVSEERVTVVLVEQNARLALQLADHGYVLEGGAIIVSGAAEELRQSPTIRHAYLGR